MSLLGSLVEKNFYIATCAFKFNLKRPLYIWTRDVNSNTCCLNTTTQLFIHKGRPENLGHPPDSVMELSQELNDIELIVGEEDNRELRLSFLSAYLLFRPLSTLF